MMARMAGPGYATGRGGGPVSDLQVLWKKDEGGQGLKEPGIKSGCKGQSARLKLPISENAMIFTPAIGLPKIGETRARADGDSPRSHVAV
jgi:hypothetical protein